jgi:hypothetical protein
MDKGQSDIAKVDQKEEERNFTFRIPAKTLERMKEAAWRERQSAGAFTRAAVGERIEKVLSKPHPQ